MPKYMGIALYGIAAIFNCYTFLWQCSQAIWHIAYITSFHSQRAKTKLPSTATKKGRLPQSTFAAFITV
jgi:hypothetical protein